MDHALYNRLNNERVSDRQINELIGLARGLCADGSLNDSEVLFLQTWLAGNTGISDHPIVGLLYRRISEILADDVIDEDERLELFDALKAFSNRDFELGEALKATTLPVCKPAPHLNFSGEHYCFTGTFNFGKRKECEAAVTKKGASVGPLTKTTNILVIGVYATDSWRHSSFGNKIIRAVEMREAGHPLSIVSEEHWIRELNN